MMKKAAMAGGGAGSTRGNASTQDSPLASSSRTRSDSESSIMVRLLDRSSYP